MDISKIHTELAEISSLRKKLKDTSDEIETKTNNVQSLCTHSTYYKDEKYSSGGYDYTSQVMVTETCFTCGKVLRSYRDPKHIGQHG